MVRKNPFETRTPNLSRGDLNLLKRRRSGEQLRREEAKRLAPFTYLEDINTDTREAFLSFIENGNTWRSYSSKSKNVKGLVVVLMDAPQNKNTPDHVIASLLRYTTYPGHDIATDDSDIGDAQFRSAYIAKSALEKVLTNPEYLEFTNKDVDDSQVKFLGTDRILSPGNLIEQGNNFTNRALGVSIFSGDTEFAFSDYDKVVVKALSDVVMSQDMLLHVERAAKNREHNPHLDVPQREFESQIDVKSVFDLETLARSDGGFTN